MQVVIDIDENVYTRLFDNGTKDYEIINDDLFAIAKSIRKGTPLFKGHWEDDCGNLKCPKCETVVRDVNVFSPLTKYTNACWFCPICGADMREVEE